MDVRERQEVQDDFLSLKAAGIFVNGKLAQSDTAIKNGLMYQASIHLDKLDAIKTKAYAGQYSQEQLACKASIGGKDTAFRDLLRGISMLRTPLLAAEDPFIAGFSDRQLSEQFMWLLQHTGITCLPVGVMASNPNNNIKQDENKSEESAGSEVVWGSLDSRGGIVLRGWPGRRVPLALLSWFPGATPDVLRDALNERSKSCEMLCHSVSTGLIQVNEVEYLNTNLAVIRPALQQARLLWGLDPQGIDTASEQIHRMQDEHRAATAAGDLTVQLLKDGATVAQSKHIDRTTVAFAAAYLVHYAPLLDLRDKIRDKHIPKLLLKIAKEHSAVRRVDNLPLLKPYDTAGSYLDEVASDVIGKKKHLKISTQTGRHVQISWDELPQLIAMSNIVTANMGVCCNNYMQLKGHGLHDSPFEVEGKALGYFCAGPPLFNRHYTDAVADAFPGAWPPMPTAGGSPKIPDVYFADTNLGIVMADAILLIRDTCHTDYDPTSDMAIPNTLLRYHSAIFIVFANQIAESCVEYMTATGPDTATTRVQCLSTIERMRSKIVEAGTNGWLDTTSQNSGYTAPYLRSRMRMLDTAIRAHNANTETRVAEFVREVGNAQTVIDSLRAQAPPEQA